MAKKVEPIKSAAELLTKARQLQQQAADVHLAWRKAKRDSVEAEKLRAEFIELNTEYCAVQQQAQEAAIVELHQAKARGVRLVKKVA